MKDLFLEREKRHKIPLSNMPLNINKSTERCMQISIIISAFYIIVLGNMDILHLFSRNISLSLVGVIMKYKHSETRSESFHRIFKDYFKESFQMSALNVVSVFYLSKCFTLQSKLSLYKIRCWWKQFGIAYYLGICLQCLLHA